MATNQNARDNLPEETRGWRLFAYHGFARIVARKHGLAVPELPDGISDEELEVRLRVVQELAHLPPA